MSTLHRPLNDIMEFDHVIEVHADGTVTDGPPGVYAPELYEAELSCGEDAGWSLMDGYSGQQGYSGPLMHQSEYIGGGMERDILARPGLYVALVSYPDDDSEPTEWAVAYRAATRAHCRQYLMPGMRCDGEQGHAGRCFKIEV